MVILFLILGIVLFCFMLWFCREYPEMVAFRSKTINRALFGIVFFAMLIGLGVYINLRKGQSAKELSQFITLYPKAEYVASPRVGNAKERTFESKDDTEKIRSFYEDLARQQGRPFRQIDDWKFSIGEGEQHVVVNVHESGTGSYIRYMPKKKGN